MSFARRRNHQRSEQACVDTLEPRVLLTAGVRKSDFAPKWFRSEDTSPTDTGNVVQGSQGTFSVEGEYILRFRGKAKVKSVTKAIRFLAEDHPDFEVVRGLGRRSLVLVRHTGDDVSAAVAALAADDSLVSVQPNYVADLQTNDPGFSDLWGLENTGQTGGTVDVDIDAPEAWKTTTGFDTVTAVIDSGVDHQHPDLIDNMWVNPGEIAGNGIDDDRNGFVDDVHGYDFVNNDGDPMDDHGHGTHVAGTLGATGDNGLGVVGVAHATKMMALKFLDHTNTGSTADAIRAVNYTTMMRLRGHNVRVSNNSWGGGAYSPELERAIRDNGRAGVILVAAAGNSDGDSDQRPLYPAAYDLDTIVSVASTDHNDATAHDSNYGRNSVDLAAPGVDIVSTVPNRRYLFASGTSMASPHVAGTASLLFSLNPLATVADVKAAILEGVDSITDPKRTVTNGRLNAASSADRVFRKGPTVQQESTNNGLAITVRGTQDDDEIAFVSSGTAMEVMINGVLARRYQTSEIASVVAIGRRGHDRISVDSRFTFATTLSGAKGHDELRGGSGPDVLIGAGGNDRMIAGSGNDVIFGNSGQDVLLGEGGSDTLWGGTAEDIVVGGRGADEVRGQTDSDMVITEHLVADDSRLDQLFAEWTANRPLQDRINRSTDLLRGQLVNDGVVDSVHGLEAIDWLVGNL